MFALFDLFSEDFIPEIKSSSYQTVNNSHLSVDVGRQGLVCSEVAFFGFFMSL